MKLVEWAQLEMWDSVSALTPITLLARFTNKIEPINEVGAGNEPDLTTSQYFIWRP